MPWLETFYKILVWVKKKKAWVAWVLGVHKTDMSRNIGVGSVSGVSRNFEADGVGGVGP